MKTSFLTFLVLIFGFSLVTNPIYGCGTKSANQESSHKEQTKQNNQEKDCCADSKEDCDNQEKDCHGNCNSKACHCTSIFLSFLISSTNEISFSRIPTLESLNFFYLENNFPSAFLSIWSPPKIA